MNHEEFTSMVLYLAERASNKARFDEITKKLEIDWEDGEEE